jgi:hypothetical protein
MTEFSTHQLKAADEIEELFCNGIPNVRWNILFAQPQSGKTDTYYRIAANMLRTGKIKNIVIMCGNPDTNLKNQTRESIEAFLDKYDAYLEDILFMGRNDRIILKAKIRDNIHLIWGKDLTKEPEFKSDTLIIWDESHAAQKKGMRPDIFFKKMDITCDGDIEKLEKNNNYVLSVSATPFSELSDLTHEEGDQFKGKVTLEVSDRYYGIIKMMELSRLKGFKFWPTKLDEVMQNVNENYASPKYAIIRVKNDKLSDMVKNIAFCNGWIVKECNSDKSAEMNNLDCLKNEPTQHTIIIIKGMCRMGKVLDKKHIKFVMETSNDSNSDVVLQGLVARMFGWHQFRTIDVYINEKILKRDEIRRYIGQINGENVIPSRATNLVKPTTQRRNTKNEIIPIRITKAQRIIDGSEEVSFLDTSLKNEVIESCRSCLADGRCENFNSQEQSEEIVSNFESIKIRIIRIKITQKSYVKFAEKIHQSISSKTPCLLGSSGGCDDDEIKIYVFTYSDARNNIACEDAFIIARTQCGNGNENDIKALVHNVPRTTKKEVFCGRTETGNIIESNGVYSIPIPVETSNNPGKMLTTLSDLIELCINTQSLEMPRKITSNYSNEDQSSFKWNGIVMNKTIETALLPRGRIFNALKRKYGVEIRLVKSRGRPMVFPSGYEDFVRYAEIAW